MPQPRRAGNARLLAPADLIFVLIPTAFLATTVSISSQTISFPVILFIFLINLISLSYGRALFILPLPAFNTTAQYIAGLLILSLVTFLFCRTLTSSADSAFLAQIGPVGILIFNPPRRIAIPKTTSPDLAIIALASLTAFIWSWQAITAVPHLLTTAHFNAWSDYFIHAGEITQFANFAALHGTTIFAAGAPLPLYHYASYMPAAALTSLTKTLSLTAATAFWTPLSFLLLGLSAAILGSTLSKSPTGGLLAFIAVLLIPSASHYGLQNPFFDVHWLLQISSGAAYGIACANLSLTALITWLRTRRHAALAYTALFTLTTFEFHVQIFAPLFLTNTLIIITAWRPTNRFHRPAGIVAALIFIPTIIFTLQAIPRAPHFFTGTHHPIAQLLFMHASTPSPYATFYPHLVASSLPAPILLLIGIALLLIAAFGALLPLYLAAILASPQRRSLENLIPLAALASYLAILISFPANPSEQMEFAHRPYVLIYNILAIWTAHFAQNLIPRLVIPQTMVPAAIILLITPLTLQSKAQLSSNSFGPAGCGLPIPTGLIATATYIRTHTPPSAIIAASPSPLDEPFLALAQRAEFAPSTSFFQIQSGLSQSDQTTRAAALAKILSNQSPGATDIVTFPPTPPPANALFTAGGFAIRPAS